MTQFITATGVGSQDWLWATRLDIRNQENGRPGVIGASHWSALMNGGRPREARRLLRLDTDTVWGVMGALSWEQDTSGMVEEVRRLAWFSRRPFRTGPAGFTQLRALCTVGIWRAAHGDYRDIERAVERARTMIPAGMSDWDSTRSTQYAKVCFAVLEAMHAAGLRQPDSPAKLAAVDEAARTYNLIESVPTNLIVSRLAEAAGDLELALRAARRRAGDDAKFQPYLSTFLRQEGRLATLIGDTAGAISAYRHFLMLRPNPEPELRSESARVGVELARLRGKQST